MSELNGNGKRWQPTISLGNVLTMVAMGASVALVYASMSSRIAVLEAKMDFLTNWVIGITNDHKNHQFTGPP